MKRGYVLGINGWPERSHDAAACLLRDGVVVAMAEEERFTRRKHAYDEVPANATRWCLEEEGITLDALDVVAVGWDYPALFRRSGRRFPKTQDALDTWFPRQSFPRSRDPELTFVPHHVAHAASASYLSGSSPSTVLVVDGQGEQASVSAFRETGGTLEPIFTNPVGHSLGYFYEAVSEYIGLGVDAPGKTMGLAPYGKAVEPFDDFVCTSDGYAVSGLPSVSTDELDQQRPVVDAWLGILRNRFGAAPRKRFRFDSFSQDVAASAQAAVERVVVHLAKTALRRTGDTRIGLAGGVALNCNANTSVAQLREVSEIFVPPFANDAGTAVGAALYVAGSGCQLEQRRLESALLGPSYSDARIRQALVRQGVRFRESAGIAADVAGLLASGRIVSWFQGPSETGPRALGARSILAHPGRADMKDRVNDAKGRERWRPLAPSILAERAGDYLESALLSPFMLHTFVVRPEQGAKVPAIVHVDGSTRPQAVTKDDGLYRRLIERFEELTGLPLVLDTSFNGPGEPIVLSPEDALRSFTENRTDALAIGNCIVER